FSCYMIRIVTLPGWMYITNQHVCFYASLPGKKKGPHKTGYLTKKNHVNSPRSFRYYFELSGHVLSWYESAESKYLPLNSIDLVGVIRVDMYKPKKFGIRLQTDTGRYFLFADSQVSQKEWFDELRKGIFLAQNSGSSIRVALPLANVIAIEKPSVFQFAENIKISISDGDDEGEDIKEVQHNSVITLSWY
ncbi:PH-domain-containing protein, partial [Rhizopus microsporus var. microsporus]